LYKLNPNARGIDVYLGSIAHTYADSWSHEGFTGFISSMNKREDDDWIVPDWGHLDSGSDPDIIVLNTANKNKAVEAAITIFRALPDGPNGSLKESQVLSDLNWAFLVYKPQDGELTLSKSEYVVIRKIGWLLKDRFGFAFDTYKYRKGNCDKKKKYFLKYVH